MSSLQPLTIPRFSPLTRALSKLLFSVLAPLFTIAIVGLPVLAVAQLLDVELIPRFVKLLASPLVFSLAYILVAGLLSQFGRPAVVRGKFPRDIAYPIYAMRRLYGLCWCSVYYFKPLYALCLGLGPLKWLLFRLFGYRGSLDFTVYPDTWIRDLPLLRIGPGAYLSNRATIGTNIVLSDGDIFVDGIQIGDGALIGHLAMVAPGANIGDRSEVGVGAAIGISARVEEEVRVGPRASVDHGAQVGQGARIGTLAYLGVKSQVEPGERLPPGTFLRRRSTTESTRRAA